MPHTPPRYRRYLKLAIAASLLLWFTRFAYLRMTLQPTPRDEFWSAQLAALDPPPPGAIRTDIVSQIVKDRPFEIPPPSADIDESRLDALEAALTGEWDPSRADIRLAIKVVESPDFNSRRQQLIEVCSKGWQYAHEIESMALADPLPSAFSWVKWLRVHARWSLHRGDSASAMADWVCIANLSRQTRRTGMLWVCLLAGGHLGRLGDELAYVSHESDTRLNVQDLGIQLDKAAGPPASAKLIFEGERINTRAWLDRIYVRDGGNWLAVNAAEWQSRVFLYDLTLNEPPSAAWNLLAPFFHDYPTAVARLDAQISAYLGCDDMVSAHKAESAFPRSNCIDVRDGICYPNTGLGDSLALYYRYCTQFEAGIALLAIRDFKRKTGALPNALSELVPSYLPRLPVDYADQKPLRYKRTGSDFRLYSVGIDGIDQSGEGSKLDRHDWGESSDFRFDNRTRPAPRSK